MSAVRSDSTRPVRHLPQFFAVVVGGFALYAVMRGIEDGLTDGRAFFAFEGWPERAADSVWWRILWFFGDLTEAQFYKASLGGIGVLLFAFLAYGLDRARSRWRGFPIAYGTGLLPWIVLASSLGLALSLVLFGDNLAQGWAPTFVPFVSVPAAVVLVYGGSWRVAVTGAVLGALFTFPIAYLLIQEVLAPGGLPPVIGNVASMWIGGIIVLEVCRQLPWMRLPEPQAADVGPTEDAPETAPAPPEESLTAGRGWFPRRVLADFSEAQFFGNELASAGLILGTLLTWLLNPLNPAYGSGLLPGILLSQVLAAAVGILLYQRQWEIHGWYPTFVPVVSVAPAAVLAFGGTMQSIVCGAVLGAVAGPPLAQLVIRNLPGHWQPVIANTFSMMLITVVIVPMLAFMPGFTLAGS